MIVIPVLFLFAIISCSPAQNDTKQTQQQNQIIRNQMNVAEPAPAVAPATAPPSATPAPAATGTAVPPAQATPVQSGSEVMMNPPHGQPFHRCDIPVGSPLNAPPATTTQNIRLNSTAPTIQNAQRMNPGQNTSSTGPTNANASRLNPPHGQPGHRCDIPVGSPL